MTRAELDELGYIVPIATVPSVLQHGILSHRRANRVAHDSIALEDVQNLRAGKVVPNGRALHEYANLYICPRNPMLRRRSDVHKQICVLRVNTDVLDIPNVIVTDSNAASKYVSFKPRRGWPLSTEIGPLLIGGLTTIRSNNGVIPPRSARKCSYRTMSPPVTFLELMYRASKAARTWSTWCRPCL